MMGDINLANLLYAVAALALVWLGLARMRLGDGKLTLGRAAAYLVIWLGLLLAIAFVYKAFKG